MSNNIFIVIIEDDRFGAEVGSVYSDLDRAIESVEFEVRELADSHNFDMDDPENEAFIQWGRDRSYCAIEQIGFVWIADRIVDYVE